jgi:hypothetical protein
LANLRNVGRADAEQIRHIDGPEELQELLASLIGGQISPALKHSAAVVATSIEHFQVFYAFLVGSFGSRPTIWALWGLFFLFAKVVPLFRKFSALHLIDLLQQVASESDNAMATVATMMKRLGQRLELFNEYCKERSWPKQTKEAGIDVHLEITNFFAASIRFFRRNYQCRLLQETPPWFLFDQASINANATKYC